MNSAAQTPRRLNLRALIILAVVIVVPGAGFFAVRAYQDQKGQSSFLAEAAAHSTTKNMTTQSSISTDMSKQAGRPRRARAQGPDSREDAPRLRRAPRGDPRPGADPGAVTTSKPDDPKRLGALKRLTILNLRSGTRTLRPRRRGRRQEIPDLVDPKEATKPDDPTLRAGRGPQAPGRCPGDDRRSRRLPR